MSSISKRNRNKMAKVQQRKLHTGLSKRKEKRSAIYNSLISLEESQKILKYLSFGFEKDLYKASLNNLSDKGNPLRFNNFAYCMREIISLILSRYSTDEDILRCCWYTNETDDENGITRAQRFKYIIQGGLSDDKLSELFQFDEDEDEDEENHIAKRLKEFTKLFRELNQHTHLREKRFNIGDKKCEALAHAVISTVFNILKIMEDLRDIINKQVESVIDEILLEEFISQTYDEIDVLSSHSNVDNFELDSYAVSKICSQFVLIQGQGIANCVLEWGSNSDMRNDIGATMDESFVFDFSIQASLDNLRNLSLAPQGIVINTSPWWND
ncbi:hypothetical protein [Klebsiella pneumoniae]|uniref:pPIWI-associating nuclease domain-containing protein n=1 Tax=Klebsiella pneumoniae TaxID=573 RepID=UPI0028742918|nr:hypothetical protein [Klebsiella pneumoniae]MDS0505008.1 hypothetical protein [Klebsiella pneumoniae]MDU9068312.1 hypothetical protein [Klebsiella pneumoniae]MDU9080544.1 hypothetical protein [Klebsiella pneumoniae]HBS2481257.1 hypothetical protein [Klebsiella pneumoniae]HEE0420143.1 hypothetical protein [Klebsiella pneumoniae]